ncbi:hypothetical protein ACGFJT_40995 [Actinomadura geliboluensis]|uniref:hypothetical protein n=1 Tax=Actinomadura geliboluensis TaxID=882440 RepID=UPI00371F7B41
MQHQVVASPGMGPFVIHDRGEFRLGEQLHESGTDDHAGAQSRQAVGRRCGMGDDAHAVEDAAAHALTARVAFVE